MDAAAIERSLGRMAHEIAERNPLQDTLALIGIRTNGVPLARRLAGNLQKILQRKLPLGELDISMHRDDLALRETPPLVGSSNVAFNVDDKTVVLVDDVLFTGRSIRAALDEILDFGRPRCIQLAVLVDRGHRELPIRADFVGKNVPTALNERVSVYLTEVDGKDEVATGEMKTNWQRKDLLGLQDLSVDEINTVLDTAGAFKQVGERTIKKVPSLRGKTLVNLFIEPSTRTRSSFELAAKRLSADVININTTASSLVKGETLKDTALNLQALNADIIVIRHSAAGAPHFLARLLQGQRDQCRRRRARASDPGAARCVHDSGKEGPHRKGST